MSEIAVRFVVNVFLVIVWSVVLEVGFAAFGGRRMNASEEEIKLISICLKLQNK